MSLFSIFQVAGSGMAAQSQRLNAVASNLANAESASSPDGQVYRARHVLFAEQPVAGPAGNAATGVGVTAVIEDQTAPRKVYDPRHPLADAQGYIAMPNVNPVDEMVDMISASRAYQNNVETFNAAKALVQKTLSIGQ